MIHKYVAFFFCAALVFFGAGEAHAAVIRSGDIVTVPADAVVPTDFYALGSDITISGTVEGDVYAIGRTVIINGTVKGDVFALGATVTLHGATADDVRIVGGKVVVAEDAGGDLMVVGGSASLLSTAQVAEDLFFYGGRLSVEGEVVGTVHVQSEEVVVNAPVGALEAVVSQELILADGARVKGDVKYESVHELSRAQNVSVGGEIMYTEPQIETEIALNMFLSFWFMALFSALVLVLLMRNFIHTLFVETYDVMGVCGFLGVGALFVIPLVSVLLMVSVIGIPVGIFLVIVFCALILFSLVLTQIFIGALLARTFVHAYKINWLWATVGVVATQALIFVPVVGPLLILAAFFVVFGMMLYYTYRSVRV